MNRLSKFIESEFTRNSWFYAQAESSMMTAMDFIDNVLKDESLVNMTQEERKYIDQVRECYLEMQSLTGQMKEVIKKYRQAYYEALKEC